MVAIEPRGTVFGLYSQFRLVSYYMSLWAYFPEAKEVSHESP
jgi:hypothetical protein